MLTKIYAIYDNKALVYGTPFFAINDGVALRSFGDLANDLQTSVGRHPGDFSMFVVGQFDDQPGQVTGIFPAQHVADAVALVRHQGRLPLTDTERVSEEFFTNGLFKNAGER